MYIVHKEDESIARNCVKKMNNTRGDIDDIVSKLLGQCVVAVKLAKKVKKNVFILCDGQFSNERWIDHRRMNELTTILFHIEISEGWKSNR